MPTEEVVWGMSGFLWLRILFLVAVAVFIFRMLQLLRVLKMGASDDRFNHWGLRVATFFKEVMGQSRMFSEPIIGWAHPVIFWGFCLFVIASALMLLGGMFPSIPIPQVEQIPVLGTFVDLFAVVVIVGLVAAGIRRYALTPEGLQRTWDASLILVLIAGLMVTFLLVEAGGKVEGVTQTWLPAGAAVAAGLQAIGVSTETIAKIGVASWWIHVVILLGFLIYLPYSKHMHLLWAPAAVLFAELPDKGTLPPATFDESTGKEAPLGDYTWRMLLSAYSCAECGRCDRSCPASASGSTLSPREVIHQFKEYVLKTGLGKANKEASSDGNGDGRDSGATPVIPVAPSMVWGCTTCYACMERCPVRNEHVPLIVQMRRKLMDEGMLDASLQEALSSLQRYGNSLGKSPRKRFEWAKDLSTPLKNAEKEPVETLWFLGDYAAYHPSSARVSRLMATVFETAGIDFGVLLKGEKSSGNDARRAGEEGLFEMLAEQNVKAMNNSQFRDVVTTDPHSYHILRHEYANFGFDKPVLHYTELLDDCLADGRLEIKNGLAGRAVYHDACYLGRINGIYDPPRRIIQAVGLDLVEMPRSREASFCCGAGGGKIWMDEEEGVTERPAVIRIREALEMDDVTQFVVACPKDLGMFEDAVKTVGAEDRIKVVDIGELVFQAL